MQTYIIYLATNTVNGKQYVGQTQSGRLDRRIFEHLFDAQHLNNNVAFHNAILKYGIEAIDFQEVFIRPVEILKKVLTGIIRNLKKI